MTQDHVLTVRGLYRSRSHLPFWEVVERADIWKQVGLDVDLMFCKSSAEADEALLNGKVDFISGNHISPYLHVYQGKPVVCLASPSNSTSDKLVTALPIKNPSELRGMRIGDTTIADEFGGYHHPRGNHILYVTRSGLNLDEVNWIDLTNSSSEFRTLQFDSLFSGKVDATFVSGDTKKYEQAGFNVLALESLPMIGGPTLTSNLNTLTRRETLGERLVKAQVLGIHFIRTNIEKTESILENLRQKDPHAMSASYQRLAKLSPKPYPNQEGVANAYKLCCLKNPEALNISPLALWDLHYLRSLDNSGFIDMLYRS